MYNEKTGVYQLYTVLSYT